MRWALMFMANVVASAGISVAVHYYPPGYAPSPKDVVFATNTNTRAISKLAESTLEVIKRINELAPPEPKK